MEHLIGADLGGFAATANAAFLLAFSSLFSIINPIGGALIFYGVTKDFSRADREKVAALVGLYSLAIMFGALWGEPMCYDSSGLRSTPCVSPEGPWSLSAAGEC
jgi:hypothetical protein